MAAAEILALPARSARDCVVAAIEADANPTPRSVTDRILADLSLEPLVRDLLDKALPDYVGQVMRYRRQHAAVTPVGERRARLVQDGASPSGGRTRSRKWDRAAEINEREIALGRGVWKKLGRCTRNDLLVIIDQRRTLAQGITREQARFQRLCDELVRRNLRTVDQLPPVTTRDIMRSDA